MTEQVKLLVGLAANPEALQEGMPIELVPRERVHDVPSPFGGPLFGSLEGFQQRKFAMIQDMLSSDLPFELPQWETQYPTPRAYHKAFSKLVETPNGPWHQRVTTKLRQIFQDVNPEDTKGAVDGQWCNGLIRRQHRAPNYPSDMVFKERVLVPLAAICRANKMHDPGEAANVATDLVNKPLQYVHFDAPKGEFYYGINTQQGCAKVGRMRRDWPLKHFLAVPEVAALVAEVAGEGENHADVLAADLVKDTDRQRIWNRLFLRELLNVWTDTAAGVDQGAPRSHGGLRLSGGDGHCAAGGWPLPGHHQSGQQAGMHGRLDAERGRDRAGAAAPEGPEVRGPRARVEACFLGRLQVPAGFWRRRADWGQGKREHGAVRRAVPEDAAVPQRGDGGDAPGAPLVHGGAVAGGGRLLDVPRPDPAHGDLRADHAPSPERRDTGAGGGRTEAEANDAHVRFPARLMAGGRSC
mmetsp:Transcript_83175/g.258304  ORF Transcript_83175/g.258304 Transcript_83175/m.258304 type:complete len:467 (-) Transcript_83175:7-1407(-)